ncbi:MAG: VWA domain-containing protein [Chlorobi bacterium]|nr:VWA domain-containing protein [Chlorobiota bacterium]
MKILFDTEHYLLYVIVCLIIAAGITGIVYYRNKETVELGKWQTGLLLFLRFSSVFLLSVLLLSPLVKTIKRFVYAPKVIIAFDNSSSILAVNDSTGQKAKANQILTELNAGLREKFSLINYSFGEEAKLTGSLQLNEKKSDYSDLINTVYNNHFNENVGALVVVGDGIYNKGANPLNSIQKLNFPVYTVGLGDTSIVSDSKIAGVRVNRTAISGNQFPLEVDLSFSKPGNRNVSFKIFHGKELIKSRMIKPTGEDYFTTVKMDIPAGEPGLQHYSAILESPPDERNKQNNISQFVINVLEGKERVLILSEGPHPDMGAVKEVLESQHNYDVSLFTSEPYPENFSDFNLVILNQLPSSQNTTGEIINVTAKSKTPLLFFTGGKTYLPQLNQLGLGVEILPQAGSKEEATALLNTGYVAFRYSEELIEMAGKFPPLLVPFAKYDMEPSYKVLFYQGIKNIATTRPLFATGFQGGRKVGFVFGEGIWRWRLYNYYFNESHSQFNELISSFIQYLSLRENEDNFIINYEPTYNETDLIIFNAEVYNESFEPFNEPEVTIQIRDSEGSNYQFTFDRAGEFYRLNAGNWPVGDYSFEAKVKIGEDEYTADGSFSVAPLNIEMAETRANHGLLYQMAVQTGGNFYRNDEINTLVDDIISNSKIHAESYSQASLNEIINLKWAFYLLLFLFALEWFLRKLWGIY